MGKQGQVPRQQGMLGQILPVTEVTLLGEWLSLHVCTTITKGHVKRDKEVDSTETLF